MNSSKFYIETLVKKCYQSYSNCSFRTQHKPTEWRKNSVYERKYTKIGLIWETPFAGKVSSELETELIGRDRGTLNITKLSSSKQTHEVIQLE